MLGLHPIEWFAGMDPELQVFFLSMLPITELRAAVPIGIEALGLSISTTWIMAVLGNMTPTIFILLILPKLHDWLIKQAFIGHVLKKKLADAERYFSGKYAKYGAIALILFVGIPLPFTGAWTGSLAAFVFNIRFKKALPLIFAGVCLAATLMTLITVGAGGAIRSIF